jgi:hypothetical protein
MKSNTYVLFYSYEAYGKWVRDQKTEFEGKRHPTVIYMFHTVHDTLYNHNKYKSLKSNLFSGHTPRNVYLISKLWVLK